MQTCAWLLWKSMIRFLQEVQLACALRYAAGVHVSAAVGASRSLVAALLADSALPQRPSAPDPCTTGPAFPRLAYATEQPYRAAIKSIVSQLFICPVLTKGSIAAAQAVMMLPAC